MLKQISSCISLTDESIPMDHDQLGQLDADVDEDTIDPNGSLMDQTMDVLNSGGPYTIRGILNNIIMCSSNVYVQECLTSLQSQGIVEVVGTRPFRWQLVEGSPTRPSRATESNLQHLSNTPMQYEDTRTENPIHGGFNSYHNPSREDPHMYQRNDFEKSSSVGAQQDSHEILGSQMGNRNFGSTSPPNKTGFQKQTNIGCPPPPSAELFKSLMSQCKYPSAPVKQAGGNMKNFEPTSNNPRGFFNSPARFPAPSSIGADNYHPSVGNTGFGSQQFSSGFSSRPSPPSLMDVSTSSGTKYPEPSNFSPRISHASSDNSSFGQDNSVVRQTMSNNRSIGRGSNAVACNFGTSFGQDGFSSQQHEKGFGTLNQIETRPQRPTIGEGVGNQSESRQQTPNVSSFPQPPSAQMFDTLVKKGPQSAKPVSSKNQSKKLTDLESKVINFMKQTGKQCDTLQISRGVGLRTKKDVNPSLYHMQTMGLIVKVHDKPPTWKIRHENLGLLTPDVHGTTSAGQTSYSPKSANHLGSEIPNFPHSFPDARMQGRSQPFNPLGKRSLSVDDRQPQKAVHYEGTLDIHKSISSSSQPEVQTQALSKVVHSAINQNPVSALNEYAQRNRLELQFEVINEGRSFNKPPFKIAAVLGGQMYPAATASNMKDARREACDMALRALLGQNLDPGSENIQLNMSQPSLSSLSGARTHFDMIAALSQHAFVQLAATIPEKFAGRKVIACIVMKRGAQDPGNVVSLGAGNRCVTGQRLSMEGKVVNDSHAEIVARRSLHRFFYSQLNSFFDGHESIFEKMNNASLLKLKEGISFHLYISTAPCGDGALFTPRLDDVLKESDAASHQHSPEFSGKSQGILRTKIEDGEGTIPIDPNEGPQTWDGLLRGERLRTMSCSDKICRWNVVGLQGALLSHFIEPIYLESLTLGYLYDHGHLSRAVCCRMQHKVDLGADLSKPFKVNHPLLGRVTAYEATRHTEKTNNMSVNWTCNDTGAEVTDGRTGACLSRTNNSPTPSRICKASLYNLFKGICSKAQRDDLLNSETYREAKDKATGFQSAKRLMFECIRKSKYGSWVSKPPEQEMF